MQFVCLSFVLICSSLSKIQLYLMIKQICLQYLVFLFSYHQRAILNRNTLYIFVNHHNNIDFENDETKIDFCFVSVNYNYSYHDYLHNLL